ncbi:hypothetical protein Droror1_Dr00016235 [Drosera rotundifolia]
MDLSGPDPDPDPAPMSVRVRVGSGFRVLDGCCAVVDGDWGTGVVIVGCCDVYYWVCRFGNFGEFGLLVWEFELSLVCRFGVWFVGLKMMREIELGLEVLGLASSFVFNSVLSSFVFNALESENKDAKLFNCVQRGHQNSLELMPVFFTLSILGGLRLPIASAAIGLFYIVSRYFYFTGYASAVPEK